MPVDARKPLGRLHAEWERCTRCSLGVRREAMNLPISAGRGVPGRILLLGGAPGRQEEWTGDPFQTEQGALLKGYLTALNLVGHCYYMNVVMCRSCVPDIDPATGTARMRKQQGMMLPVFNDNQPNTAQLEACRPRLMEEIYLVDPVIIVALGAVAISAMLGRQTSVTSARKDGPQHISIPGAGAVARITEKRKQWGRKVQGEMQWPTDQSSVQYLMVPTFDPLFVKLSDTDTKDNSPGRLFGDDLRKVQRTFSLYAQQAELPVTPPYVEEEGPNYDDYED